jgi:hypothetical protein
LPSRGGGSFLRLGYPLLAGCSLHTVSASDILFRLLFLLFILFLLLVAEYRHPARVARRLLLLFAQLGACVDEARLPTLRKDVE